MDAYMWCRRGGGAAACEEQEEDIGSPSTSAASSARSSESSSELADDASSSSSSSADHRFEMSDLMTQLPFKRGLSRFFDGKSQSFASLAAVASLEDLAKPPRKRLKPSQSCGGGLDAHRGRVLSPRRHCPKAVVAGAKKATARAALSVLSASPRRPPLAAPARPEGVAAKFLVVN
uniref:Oxidative stress 3 n=1 Tax=Oryza punctata TaxID=4537 RepID=A0A0E0K3P9_ORYPU